MSRCKPTARRFNHAFTLVEMMVVIVLLAIFTLGLYQPVTIGLRTVTAGDQREQLRQQLANGFEQFIRELEMTGRLDLAQAQQVQFDADIDGDGIVDRNIWYGLNGTAFQRTANGATVTLIKDVTALQFTYVDLLGVTLPSPVVSLLLPNVRLVQVSVTAGTGSEMLAMASAAFLRNM